MPSGRDETIAKSGKTDGSPGFHWNVDSPSAVPAPPGCASSTMEKPEPNGRSYTGHPSGVVPVAGTIWSSARTSPK